LRRKAERRLVQQEKVGPGDERTGDRKLLLLAAGERAGLAALNSATIGKSSCTQATSSPTPSRVRRPASPSRRFSSTVRLA
jgi:hypothetical protein